jgi:hypothetical protein
MKCHYHPDRDATGQCEECRVFLCHECCNQRIVGRCYKCVEENRHARRTDKISSAKWDIRIFGIFAILAGIFACLLYSQQPLLTAVMQVPLTAYGMGAAFVGVKRALGWIMSNMDIFVMIASPVILMAGLIIGIFVAPYWLYNARKTLRGT